MPRGVPRLGSRSSGAEELQHAPAAESLGTMTRATTETGALVVDPRTGKLIDPGETASRPPWEVAGIRDNTDARSFVTVPENWVLRWINPRMIDHIGWRDWQPVMASDPRVTVKVREMASPEGNIRRGRGGDVLGWMYRSWYESRLAQKADKVRRVTGSMTDRAEELKEQTQRGAFGPYNRVDAVRVPTNTNLDGSSVGPR